MLLITKLTQLADKIVINTDIQTVKEYSRLLIDLANDRQDAEKKAKETKLSYDSKYRQRFEELIEELKAVNKTEKAVELELMQDKETYKNAEAEAERYKALYNAHVNNLWIAKLDLEQGKTADVSTNMNSQTPF